jgi:hypothetical protein
MLQATKPGESLHRCLHYLNNLIAVALNITKPTPPKKKKKKKKIANYCLILTKYLKENYFFLIFFMSTP